QSLLLRCESRFPPALKGVELNLPNGCAETKLPPSSGPKTMKVVILCGGRGTRLREETEFRPKPMVPIGNQPILWHIMKYYAQFGHKEFVLCLGYKGEMIKDYFRNYLWNRCDISLSLGRQQKVRFHDRHPEEDWTVTLADTGEESMTAYRVKLIQRHIPKG